MQPGRQELERLAQKYRTLAALRRERAAGKPPPPARVFKELAAEFPGALRELDTLPLEVIEARADQLARAADGAAPAPWMAWLHDFHALMRAALRIKGRLHRVRQLGDDDAATLASHASREADQPIDVDFVRSVAQPPAGRLMPIVLGRLADRYGRNAREIADELFPSRAERLARRPTDP